MRRHRSRPSLEVAPSAFAGFRFPPEAIVLAVCWSDLAHPLARAIEELAPDAFHNTDQYANDHVECDHGRLKARLRPMRGIKTDRSARTVIRGHALIQNLRRGHYELGTEARPGLRLAAAFDEPRQVI